ncbi:MAG: hypothetical protein E6J23_08865 [Chloroflexi bacterium]|nr:MAG: hypothetical protein E6J23_08865 [Chloroflexota bacterium]
MALGRRQCILSMFALLFGIGCGMPPEIQGKAGGPTTSVTASPSPTIADTRNGTSPLLPVTGFPGVETRPLGIARGEHVFVTRVAPSSSSVPFGELWIIPLSNGADARALVRYPGYATPWLPSRLSPDGLRYAFELDRGDGVRRIAIANLTDGSVKWLLTDNTSRSDTQPAWSPTGDRLGFVSDNGSTSATVRIINVDGSAMRRLVSLADSSPVYMHQWTADGRFVAFYQGIGYDTVDVSTGSRVHMNGVVSADASWRVPSPHLVAHAYTSVSAGDEQTIFVADDAAGTRKVLARGVSTSEFLNQPHWRPNVDEFVYAFSDYPTGRKELRVRSLSGAERKLPVTGASPTWSSDGSAIVYMHEEEVQLPGTGEGAQSALVLAEIRVIDADGTGDRLLYRSAATDGPLPPNWCVCNDAIATRRL